MKGLYIGGSKITKKNFSNRNRILSYTYNLYIKFSNIFNKDLYSITYIAKNIYKFI